MGLVHLIFFVGLLLASGSSDHGTGSTATWVDKIHPLHFVSDKSGNWTKLSAPMTYEYIVIFLWAAIFAAGDAAYECQVPAALQAFFQDGPHVLGAMANYKLWQSLGFAVQFVLGAVLSDQIRLRMIICLALLLFAWCGLLNVRRQLVGLGEARGPLLES